MDSADDNQYQSGIVKTFSKNDKKARELFKKLRWKRAHSGHHKRQMMRKALKEMRKESRSYTMGNQDDIQLFRGDLTKLFSSVAYGAFEAYLDSREVSKTISLDEEQEAKLQNTDKLNPKSQDFSDNKKSPIVKNQPSASDKLFADTSDQFFPSPSELDVIDMDFVEADPEFLQSGSPNKRFDLTNLPTDLLEFDNFMLFDEVKKTEVPSPERLTFEQPEQEKTGTPIEKRYFGVENDIETTPISKKIPTCFGSERKLRSRKQ